tara:strand:+ start:58 stop:363 length:306 start_codon:yes stop_codon:yes gene_type:complete
MENLERFKELAEKHNTEIILEWDETCDWFFYEEDGACGYPLQISTSKPNQLVPSENIYSAIGESVYSLAEAIMNEDVKRLYFNSEELLYSNFEDLEDELDS